MQSAPDTESGVRPRRTIADRFPNTRRMSIAALRAGRHRSPMHGLIEVDVTEAMRLIASRADLSLTAYVVASVARAAAQHPEVHSYRDMRGRLIRHTHVDVNTLVEVQTAEGPFPLAVVVSDADVRSVEDITRFLHAVKQRPATSGSGRFLKRSAMAVTRVPYLATLIFRLGSRSIWGRQRMGTISVTAVGMFGAGSGYGIGGATIYSLTVVVGGLSRAPRVVGDHIEPRDVLNLTVTVDHNMVDGAPAARFVAELRGLLETAAALVTTN